MKWPKDLAKSMGITQIEIVFKEPKKVMLKYDGSVAPSMKNVEMIENATTILIEEGPLGTTIHVNSQTATGESSHGSSIKNIEELVVLD